MNEKQQPSLEDHIAARPAAKVTPQDIEAEIASEHYFTAADGAFGAAMRLDGTSQPPADKPPLSTLTFVVLTLRNGFTVTGESAYASPENFDAQIGREVARRAAVAKMWPLLGYALRDQLSGHRTMTTQLPPLTVDGDKLATLMAERRTQPEPPEAVMIEFNVIENPNDFGRLVVAIGRRGTLNHEEREAVKRLRPSNTDDDARRFITEAKQRAAARIEAWFAAQESTT